MGDKKGKGVAGISSELSTGNFNFDFYDNKKEIIWLLNVYDRFTGEKLRYQTGFSITQTGLVITTAFPPKNCIIEARRLHEINFNSAVEIIANDCKWNIALLKVKNVNDCSVGTLARDATLVQGQHICCIGNYHNFVGSFIHGEVAYKCEDCPSLPTINERCEDYICYSKNKTGPYRVMGDVLNMEFYEEEWSDQYIRFKGVHPNIPIIQCIGLRGHIESEGAPVFNSDGQIVGMYVLEVHTFQIAVHVSMLKEFLKKALQKVKENLPDDLEQLRRAGGVLRHQVAQYTSGSTSRKLGSY